MIDCVVLCGGKREMLAEEAGVDNKALVRIGDREMVVYVLAALAQVEEIDRLAVVGPVESLSFLCGDFSVEIVPEQDSILRNIHAAIVALGLEQPLLICTADIPLLTLSALQDFIEKCRPFEHDFYYPVVRKERCEEVFPSVERTYVTLKEGKFTGGNIFLINPARLEDSLERVERFLDVRKNPLKMVSLLGPGFLLRFVSKRLSLDEVAARFSQLLQISARPVISEYPEISLDVDKPKHLQLVRRLQNV